MKLRYKKNSFFLLNQLTTFLPHDFTYQGYSTDSKYNFDSVKRILKHFYGSSSASNTSALIRVSNLIEDFFAEVAADKDLNIHTFVALGDVCCCCLQNHASSDGIYKAIDIYLEKHRYLNFVLFIFKIKKS